MRVAVDLGQDVAKKISNREKENARAKHHVAHERQIHLSHLACANQVGAKQDRHKGGHNEVVVAVVSFRQMDKLSDLFECCETQTK